MKMALQIGGVTVVDNARQLTNISGMDAGTAAVLASGFTNYVWYTASGSWTVPVGVTMFYAVIFGGGGGGGDVYSVTTGPTDAPVVTYYNGKRGGWGTCVGGLFYKNASSYSFTIGAGGIGNNTGNGGSGGTTTGFGMSANGGGGGAGSSVGTNATTSIGEFQITYPFKPFSNNLISPTLTSTLYQYINTWGADYRAGGLTSTAAIAWSSSYSYQPGSPGSGETLATTNDASGGVGGAVLIIY
jgi:hypothetical protein